ncbi:MAG TPA: transcription antitermination factor NusB, partial [Candidatus Baltobacteraceae bacterium]|nr:transcription antitermination factor NusB [Candidatus Baltobacteraceae bacterium]
MTGARDVALQTVRDVFPASPQGVERGAQAALDYRARKGNLDSRDRAFATELAYGAIKMRRALDWYLHPFIGDRPEPLSPVIREVLRLAVFELVYTRADVHATVFEWVNVAKRYGHRGVANLVNAVLRTFLRERPLDPVRELFATEEEYLGTRYSLPTWLVRQWSTVFGAETERVCASVNEPSQSAVTTNAFKATPLEVMERFTKDGVAVTPSAFVAESLLLDDGSYARRNEAAADAAWWIQSESSAMPADLLNPQPGEAVLDVCSGRGNKALQIRARMGGEGMLVCLERDQDKASVLERRFQEGGTAAAVVVGDATQQLLPPEQR